MEDLKRFPVKKLTVKVKQKNGDIYVYERQTQYDPEKNTIKILAVN